MRKRLRPFIKFIPIFTLSLAQEDYSHSGMSFKIQRVI
jgi:hypothetical protein